MLSEFLSIYWFITRDVYFQFVSLITILFPRIRSYATAYRSMLSSVDKFFMLNYSYNSLNNNGHVHLWLIFTNCKLQLASRNSMFMVVSTAHLS
jgi:hypothetical protein